MPKINFFAVPFAFFSSLFLASSILGCSADCKTDCSVNKCKFGIKLNYRMGEFVDKCVDESPLCPRLEALCDNFFLIQWKEMRCACPKTCKRLNNHLSLK